MPSHDLRTEQQCESYTDKQTHTQAIPLYVHMPATDGQRRVDTYSSTTSLLIILIDNF